MGKTVTVDIDDLYSTWLLASVCLSLPMWADSRDVDAEALREKLKRLHKAITEADTSL